MPTKSTLRRVVLSATICLVRCLRHSAQLQRLFLLVVIPRVLRVTLVLAINALGLQLEAGVLRAEVRVVGVVEVFLVEAVFRRVILLQ